MRILYIPDMALLLRRSECSIRSAIYVNAWWLPPSFRMGNRICWLEEDVISFVQQLKTDPPQRKRVGRPRRTPPRLAWQGK